tara:strand:- start:94 stop:516 length:423 start_codon:yes stop_codon:yes gene_type:complete
MANKNPIQTEKFKAAGRRAGFGSPFATAKICTGHCRTHDRPCRNRAAWGLDHCRYHLTQTERGILSRRPGHKSKPKTKATGEALKTIAAAPLDLLRLPIYQAAGSVFDRAELIRAYIAGQSGDGRAWGEIVGRLAQHEKT